MPEVPDFGRQTRSRRRRKNSVGRGPRSGPVATKTTGGTVVTFPPKAPPSWQDPATTIADRDPLNQPYDDFRPVAIGPDTAPTAFEPRPADDEPDVEAVDPIDLVEAPPTFEPDGLGGDGGFDLVDEIDQRFGTETGPLPASAPYGETTDLIRELTDSVEDEVDLDDLMGRQLDTADQIDELTEESPTEGPPEELAVVVDDSVTDSIKDAGVADLPPLFPEVVQPVYEFDESQQLFAAETTDVAPGVAALHFSEVTAPVPMSPEPEPEPAVLQPPSVMDVDDPPRHTEGIADNTSLPSEDEESDEELEALLAELSAASEPVDSLDAVEPTAEVPIVVAGAAAPVKTDDPVPPPMPEPTPQSTIPPMPKPQSKPAVLPEPELEPEPEIRVPTAPLRPPEPVVPPQATAQPKQLVRSKEPARSEEPARPAEAARAEEPAQPKDATQPIDPAQPKEPAQPRDAAQPRDTAQPKDAVQPPSPPEEFSDLLRPPSLISPRETAVIEGLPAVPIDTPFETPIAKSDPAEEEAPAASLPKVGPRRVVSSRPPVSPPAAAEPVADPTEPEIGLFEGGVSSRRPVSPPGPPPEPPASSTATDADAAADAEVDPAAENRTAEDRAGNASATGSPAAESPAAEEKANAEVFGSETSVFPAIRTRRGDIIEPQDGEGRWFTHSTELPSIRVEESEPVEVKRSGRLFRRIFLALLVLAIAAGAVIVAVQPFGPLPFLSN